MFGANLMSEFLHVVLLLLRAVSVGGCQLLPVTVNVWENHLNYCMCPPRISESDVAARGSIGNFFFYTRFFYLTIYLYTYYGVYSAPTRIYGRGAKSRIRIKCLM